MIDVSCQKKNSEILYTVGEISKPFSNNSQVKPPAPAPISNTSVTPEPATSSGGGSNTGKPAATSPKAKEPSSKPNTPTNQWSKITSQAAGASFEETEEFLKNFPDHKPAKTHLAILKEQDEVDRVVAERNEKNAKARGFSSGATLTKAQINARKLEGERETKAQQIEEEKQRKLERKWAAIERREANNSQKNTPTGKTATPAPTNPAPTSGGGSGGKPPPIADELPKKISGVNTSLFIAQGETLSEHDNSFKPGKTNSYAIGSTTSSASFAKNIPLNQRTRSANEELINTNTKFTGNLSSQSVKNSPKPNKIRLNSQELTGQNGVKVRIDPRTTLRDLEPKVKVIKRKKQPKNVIKGSSISGRSDYSPKQTLNNISGSKVLIQQAKTLEQSIEESNRVAAVKRSARLEEGDRLRGEAVREDIVRTEAKNKAAYSAKKSAINAMADTSAGTSAEELESHFTQRSIQRPIPTNFSNASADAKSLPAILKGIGNLDAEQFENSRKLFQNDVAVGTRDDKYSAIRHKKIDVGEFNAIKEEFAEKRKNLVIDARLRSAPYATGGSIPPDSQFSLIEKPLSPVNMGNPVARQRSAERVSTISSTLSSIDSDLDTLLYQTYYDPEGKMNAKSGFNSPITNDAQTAVPAKTGILASTRSSIAGVAETAKAAISVLPGSGYATKETLEYGFGMGFKNAVEASRGEHLARFVSNANPFGASGRAAFTESFGIANRSDVQRFLQNRTFMNGIGAFGAPIGAAAVVGLGMHDMQDPGEILGNLSTGGAVIGGFRAGKSAGAMLTPTNSKIGRGLGLAVGGTVGAVTGGLVAAGLYGIINDAAQNDSAIRKFAKKVGTKEMYSMSQDTRESLTARQQALNKLAKSGLNDRAQLLRK